MKFLECFLLLLAVVDASRRSQLLKKLHPPATSNDDALNVETVWYRNMRLDHFDWGDDRVFDMRIMWNNSFYQPGGPIFFYTGNEGGLESFVTATGIIFDIAPMFNASIIFAEHRFYGQSLPFGKESFKSLANIGYLTSEQALADYAEVLMELKRDNNQFGRTFSKDTQVISFGGSYGGMLSAWFRQKYPHIVKGAWAGSAPLIYMHDGGVDQGAFDNVTSRTYVENGCNRYILANAWNAVLNLSSTDPGRQWLNANPNFKLDPRTPIRNQTDGWNLNAFIREAIEYMAMVDYPYPTGFLEPLPGYPVTVACGFMNAPGENFSDEDLVTAVSKAANIYYNYNNDPNFTYCIDPSVCGDPGTGGLGGDFLAWPWQECSEIVMAMCASGGANDVFWSECGDNIYDILKDQCVGIFGSMGWNSSNWNIDAVKTLYGYDLSGASNMILTQGHLDPWSAGGYKVDQNNAARGIYVMEIPGSAHHLDLRQPNTCDPNTVANARYQIIQILKCWVDPGCHENPELLTLPNLEISKNTECKDVVRGYPWGQANAGGMTSSAAPDQKTSTITSGVQTSTLGMKTSTMVSEVQTSSASPIQKTSTMVPDVKTTTILPNVQTSTLSLKTSSAAPEVKTSTVAPNVQTSTIAPEIKTSSAAPEVKTSTILPVDQKTSTILPDVKTSSVAPNVQTSSAAPDAQKTSTIIPNIQTSSLALDVKTSTILPNVQTSSQAPENQKTSTILPEVKTSTILPNVQTSSAAPEAKTSPAPNLKTSQNPELSSKAPVVMTSTIALNVQTSSTAPEVQKTSTMVPNVQTSSAALNVQTSSAAPESKSTSFHPKMTSTVNSEVSTSSAPTSKVTSSESTYSLTSSTPSPTSTSTVRATTSSSTSNSIFFSVLVIIISVVV